MEDRQRALVNLVVSEAQVISCPSYALVLNISLFISLILT